MTARLLITRQSVMWCELHTVVLTLKIAYSEFGIRLGNNRREGPGYILEEKHLCQCII